MSPSKSPAQPHLNGAYYGPSIPAATTYRRPSTRSGATCNPLTCCFNCICSCIFNCIFQILITVAVILAVIALIFWFIFRPNVPKFHVDDVTMTKFTHSDANNTLYYNINVNMTFRNPNKRLGIYYDKIEVNGMYHGVRFGSTDVSPFYLGHKDEKNVSSALTGQQVVVFGNGVKDKYDDENKDEVYKIDLKLKMKIRFKVLWFKTAKFTPRFDCDLKVPLSAKGKASSEFERTKCDFDW